MRLRCHALFVLCLGQIAACGVDVPASSSDRHSVEFSPTAAEGKLPPVFRASGRFAAAPLPRLYLGELSTYHAARADDDPLPSTLQQRLVPLWVRRVGASSEASPLELLSSGELYTLVATPGAFTVIEVGGWTNAWRRIWPAEVATRFSWFCAQQEFTSSGDASPDVELSDGTPAAWRPTEDGRCAMLSLDAKPSAPGGLSPLSFAGLPVEPTLFRQGGGRVLTGESLECETTEQALGPGCASVQDDRILVRLGAQSGLWRFSGDVTSDVVNAAEQRAAVVGFAPGKTHHLSLQVYMSSGDTWTGEALLAMAPPQPHVVINEVLANPVGPEPQQEWVELTNDGSASVQLAELELHDGGGYTVLPEAVLEPKQSALVVVDAYDQALGLDVPPPSDVLLLRVSALGKSGLANSGEPLWLQDAEGTVLSKFPALPATQQGTSWARIAPHAVDDDGGSFRLHAPPGASPGMANETED